MRVWTLMLSRFLPFALVLWAMRLSWGRRAGCSPVLRKRSLMAVVRFGV